MENEILDDFEIEETFEVGGSPIHANKSFNQLIFSILIIAMFNFLLPFSIYNSGFLNLSSNLILKITVLILTIFGMRNAMKSETYQEVSSWKKYIGAIGNMLLFFPSLLFFLINFFELISLYI